MDDYIESSAKRSFIIKPAATVHNTAKARFIIRPDALKVKVHKPLPPLENEVSSPTMVGKVAAFED
jgi:hypothetical protein